MENMRAKLKGEGGKLEQGKGPKRAKDHSRLRRKHRIRKFTKRMKRA